jgi:hypothetical protein
MNELAILLSAVFACVPLPATVDDHGEIAGATKGVSVKSGHPPSVEKSVFSDFPFDGVLLNTRGTVRILG